METRSKDKSRRSNISSSTRSAVKADKDRQAKLKALYQESLTFTSSSTSPRTNKNKKRTVVTAGEEEREPTASPALPSSNQTLPSVEPSMAPHRTMSEIVVPAPKDVTPDKPQDTPAPTPASSSTNSNNVEASPSEISETPAQREARRAAHPLKDISEPLPTDCLFGRGGGTNHHPGNKLYRRMVEDKKELYLNSKRLDKPLVAMDIIKEWRALDPPGRFLKQDESTKLWSDVGDKKAREKTSQALREKSGKGQEDEYDKETRFDVNTKLPRGGLVTRDHSLGTEIIGNNDYFSMEGFSWDEHDNRGDYVRERRTHSHPSKQHPHHSPHNSYGSYGPPPPPPHPSHHYQASPHHPSHPYYPQHDYHPPPPHAHHERGRNNSLSINPLPGASTAKPARNSFQDERAPRGGPWHAPSYSYDSVPPLPPPYYGYPHPGWGSPHAHHGTPPPPGPPPPGHHPHADPHHPPPDPHYGRPPQSAFDPYNQTPYYETMKPAGSPQDFTKIADLMSQEEDELGITNNAEKMTRSNSNSSRSIDRSSSWGGYERKHSLVMRDTSIGSFGPIDAEDGNFFDEMEIKRCKSLPYSNSENEVEFPSPPLPLQTRKKPECVEKEASPMEDVEKPSLMRKISGGMNNTALPTLEGVVRPEPVKRDTSNQPESMETKRSVKRVVLSRDKSAISRNLKEEQKNMPLKAELIDRNLSVEINKLGLGNRPSSLSRLTTDQMLTSLLDDDVQNSLLEQPLTLDDRLDTMDALGGRATSCDIDDALELIMEDKGAVLEAPSAVNEDIAAKWLKGESFAEEDQKGDFM